jgi:hypothetical protein
MHFLPRVALSCLFLVPVASCAAGARKDRGKPGDLVAQTTVGKNRCNEADPTDRPFVVEWDATDTATFESAAQRDVIIVRYENCELEVLDGCNDDAITGKYGSYDVPKWTSGSIEGFEIDNSFDLYAKLPLGAAEFSANVEAGNKLVLRYFVSGTVNSTRAAVYKKEVGANPRCSGATHFVRAYNLGAFELDTEKKDAESVKASFNNAGAGGGRSHRAAQLKRSGELTSCTADSAMELSRCKVPIRLALRELEDGDPPAATNAAMGAAPGTSTEGKDGWQLAAELGQSAAGKSKNGDGMGCLLDLDRALEAHAETAQKMDMLRATCEMQAGKCEDGKKRYRKFMEQAATGRRFTAEELDRAATSQASQYCAGKLTPTEAAKKAGSAIHESMDAGDVAGCIRHGNTLVESVPKMPKKQVNEERDRSFAISAINTAAVCTAKLGNCKEAKRLYRSYVQFAHDKKGKELDEFVANGFDGSFRECAGK